MEIQVEKNSVVFSTLGGDADAIGGADYDGDVGKLLQLTGGAGAKVARFKEKRR